MLIDSVILGMASEVVASVETCKFGKLRFRFSTPVKGSEKGGCYSILSQLSVPKDSVRVYFLKNKQSYDETSFKNQSVSKDTWKESKYRYIGIMRDEEDDEDVSAKIDEAVSYLASELPKIYQGCKVLTPDAEEDEESDKEGSEGDGSDEALNEILEELQ